MNILATARRPSFTNHDEDDSVGRRVVNTMVSAAQNPGLQCGLPSSRCRWVVSELRDNQHQVLSTRFQTGLQSPRPLPLRSLLSNWPVLAPVGGQWYMCPKKGIPRIASGSGYGMRVIRCSCSISMRESGTHTSILLQMEDFEAPLAYHGYLQLEVCTPPTL